MSSPGNPMSWIMSVEPLTGANYPQWQEKTNMGFALFEIDKAITDKRLVEPTLLDIPNDLGADAKYLCPILQLIYIDSISVS
jgi:hypothetical protein